MSGRALPFAIDCRRPILALTFAEPRRMLSWSITRPGFTDASAVVWLEVRDADLPIGRDPHAVLLDALEREGHADAVGLMTACDVRSYRLCQVRVEDVEATVVTTVGLGNGEFVGRRRFAARLDGIPKPGTINSMVYLSVPLSDGAMVEAITMAAEARTVAIIEASQACGDTSISGTGSDCAVIVVPPGGTIPYAGLHTAVGEAIGAAVIRATYDAAIRWYGGIHRDAAPSKRGEIAKP